MPFSFSELQYAVGGPETPGAMAGLKPLRPFDDGVIDFLNDEVKKQYFRWAHLYDGCMKKREDYKYEHSEYTDEQYENAFSEEEELLMTVEMALAMNLENLVEFKPE